jgi:site-specific recombinase XerC
MAKRRTVIEEVLHEEEQLLVSGGDDFQTCLDLFLKDMTMRNLAYHTKRWYKENIAIVHTTEKMLKDVIVYCMEQLGNNPTTINHRIRSMKQFYSFLHNQTVIPNNPARSLQKQKGKKEQIKPPRHVYYKKICKLMGIGYRTKAWTIWSFKRPQIITCTNVCSVKYNNKRDGK